MSVSCEHGLPARALLQCLTQVAGEASQHVDQTGLADFTSYLRVVGRSLVEEWKRFNLPGTKAFEPIDAVVPRTLMVIIGGGCRRDDADWCIWPASKLDGAQVRFGHEPAEFGAAF